VGSTADDSAALFRRAPGPATGDDQAIAPDGSPEAMRRLRNPFEAKKAAPEPEQNAPEDEEQ
jgi:hypothetical protein